MAQEAKKKTVTEFATLLDEYPVIAVVNMVNLPTRQLQTMRIKLRQKNTVLKMTKKRLLKLAFSKSKKPKIKDLEKHLKGMPALVFTKENPFKLCMELQKTKSKAPAKPGQEAPNDISVNAGPTSFAPGPIIGQLGKFGIKTGVESGKIVIKDDCVVIKKGEIINRELAEILSRLGVEPMEIGLNLTAVYEEGQIYESDLLQIDSEEFQNKVSTAYSESLNLAVYVTYANDDTISTLLNKAYNESQSLVLSQDILTDETAVDLVKKAHSEMMTISALVESSEKEKPDVKSEKQQSEKPDKEVEQAKTPDESEKPDKESDKPEQAGLGSLFG